MHVAFSVWNGRISPVFDTARTLVLLSDDGLGEKERSELTLSEDNPVLRVRELLFRDIEVLVCGAISRMYSAICMAAGIHVIAWVAGELEEVIVAFRAGRLPDPALTMPGCGRRGGGRGQGRRREGRTRHCRRRGGWSSGSSGKP